MPFSLGIQLTKQNIIYILIYMSVYTYAVAGSWLHDKLDPSQFVDFSSKDGLI